MTVKLESDAVTSKSAKQMASSPWTHTTILAFATATVIGIFAAIGGLLTKAVSGIFLAPTSVASPHLIGLLVTGILAGVVTALVIRRYGDRA
jgi:uncharacterized membrane protein (DUF106 family)